MAQINRCHDFAWMRAWQKENVEGEVNTLWLSMKFLSAMHLFLPD